MVKMVIGQYQNKVSIAGRVALPKKFRTQLGANFIVTQGYEESLLMVPFENWDNLVSSTVNKPFLVGQARDTVRFLLGSASQVDLDEQGRFIVPQYLRDYAKIRDEIVFLGLGSYIEMWDSAKWIQYKTSLNDRIEDIAEKLSKIDQK